MRRPSPLLQLTLTRFREYLREPEAVFWTLIFPILLASGLGIAFRNRPAETVHVGVVRGAPGSDSLLAALGADSSGHIAAEPLDSAAAAQGLRTGSLALVVAPAPSGVAYRYDDTRPEGRMARLVVDRALQRALGAPDIVRASDELVRERGSRYIDFVVPGLLGLNLMGSGIWGVGFAIVEARKRKLLKRLIATPMPRALYLASFLVFRLTLLVVEVVAILGFGALVFGVPLRGSLAQLAAICALAGVTFAALGLLIAARPRTVEGASGLMNFVMMPMWVASGVFFSASNFPAAVQPFIQALPLTAALDALRANMLEGAGWNVIAPEMAILAAWMTLCFAVALRVFRWR
ncbi:MAG TPA: ABC transporter permease [Gemmatimonadaceae bacterium]|nr:ABC transporter permease [Gemmatimonadaceae bacterium]